MADLQTITAANPVFAAELSADLGAYGISLSQVLGQTTTITAAAQTAAVRTAIHRGQADPRAHAYAHPHPRPRVHVQAHPKPKPRVHQHGHRPAHGTLTPAIGGDPAAISSQTLGTLRNDFSGWVGFEFTTAGNALSVSQLGRWVVAGNTGSHTLKLADAATNQDVPGGSVTLNTAGATAGQYGYVSLPAAVGSSNPTIATTS